MVNHIANECTCVGTWSKARPVANTIHMWMSHITHVNASHLKCEWIMSHMWMSHITHAKESWHDSLQLTGEWVTSHVWDSLQLTCEWVTSHMNVTHMRWHPSRGLHSQNTYWGVKSHIQTMESWHTPSVRTVQSMHHHVPVRAHRASVLRDWRKASVPRRVSAGKERLLKKKFCEGTRAFAKEEGLLKKNICEGRRTCVPSLSLPLVCLLLHSHCSAGPQRQLYVCLRQSS